MKITTLDIAWALYTEPKRVWQWMFRHDPFTGKRYGFKEAVRAVLENPPCIDISWDIDIESKYKT